MAAAAVPFSASPCGPSGLQSLRPRTRAHRSRHLAISALLGKPSSSSRRGRLPTAVAAAGKPPGEAEEQVPAWARPGADEPPPWAREGGGSAQEPGVGQVPFYTYLLASAVTAIAAIGSIFEYTNQRPVFGIINADNPLYAPLLGFFVFTGIPTSGFLWFKAVQTANKEAEEQDRRDGFL